MPCAAAACTAACIAARRCIGGRPPRHHRQPRPPLTPQTDLNLRQSWCTRTRRLSAAALPLFASAARDLLHGAGAHGLIMVEGRDLV